MGVVINVRGEFVDSSFMDRFRKKITAGGSDGTSLVLPAAVVGKDESGFLVEVTDGTRIIVPEGTAAYIFCNNTVENLIAEPGNYEYYTGDASLYAGDEVTSIFTDMVANTLSKDKTGKRYIGYLNTDVITDIKFGTKGAFTYDDLYYGIPLDFKTHGSYAVQIVDPARFLTGFVMKPRSAYTNAKKDMAAILPEEILVSLTQAMTECSDDNQGMGFRTADLFKIMRKSHTATGLWRKSYGLELKDIDIDKMEYTVESLTRLKKLRESQELAEQQKKNEEAERVRREAEAKKREQEEAKRREAEEAQRKAALEEAKRKEAEQKAQKKEEKPAVQFTFDQQVEMLKKLKELFDAGILTQEEFDLKKKQILGL